MDIWAGECREDVLEVMESLGKEEERVGELDGVRIEGIVPNVDADAQVYTFVEGEVLSLVRQVENTIDLELDKSGGYNIEILSAGKQISIKTNGGGENEIIITQSD